MKQQDNATSCRWHCPCSATLLESEREACALRFEHVLDMIELGLGGHAAHDLQEPDIGGDRGEYHDPIAVGPDASIEEVAGLMVDNNFHTIPVVQEGKLVGIVGKEDILRTLLPRSDS